MTNVTLESFVNSIRNLYQKSSSTSPQTSAGQTSAAAASSANHDINYTEVQNTIHLHLNVFYENAANLLDNVLPIFTLPEYTLPNMAVLYAVVTQLENSNTSASTSSATNSSSSISKSVTVHTEGAATSSANSTIANAINHDRLLNEVENCIQFSDERQVKMQFLFEIHTVQNATLFSYKI